MRTAILLSIAFSISIQQQYAQNFKQWGTLQPGKYKVGYKTIISTDHSRTYGGKPRVLQLYVWYPASASSSGHATYLQYFEDASRDWGAIKSQSDMLYKMLEKDFRSGGLNPSFPGTLTNEKFQEILDTRVPVTRNASAALGKFPLVLHLTSNGALHQSLMMEYVASHGYVVVSMSMYGSSPAFYGRGEAGSIGLHVMTEDLGYAIAQSRTLPFVDTSKTAVIGMMAQAGISLQMKEQLLDAIACLDCYADPALLQSLPYYDVRKVKIDMLQILNANFSSKNNFIQDSLIFSTRYSADIAGLQHPHFYPFPKIVSQADTAVHVLHNVILQNTVTFLDHVLKGEKEYEGLGAKVNVAQKKTAVPTEAEFLGWMRYGKMDMVRDAWKRFGKSLAARENLFSVVLFLARDRSPNAREAFDMYSSAYPNEPRLKMIEQFLE